VPETKGRTLEEIDELFVKKISVRDFRAFETTIMDDALKAVQNRDKDTTAIEYVSEASR
jgi:hypothetical protein